MNSHFPCIAREFEPRTIEYVELKERFKALRKGVGLTQDKLAEKAGVNRTDIVRLESGANQGGSWEMRKALAAGYQMSIEDLGAYLDGEMSLRDALAAMGEVRAERRPVPSNLDKAIDYWGSSLSPAVVATYRRECEGHENEREPAEHGGRARHAAERVHRESVRAVEGWLNVHERTDQILYVQVDTVTVRT